MSGAVDQALYGYEDGHRLIASSVPIGAEPGRILRSLTDMAFDGEADSYLTCLPLVELGRYALIRSWPAPEVTRPGAVWSHVLLVDFVDLGALDHLGVLASLFKRPKTGKDGESPGKQYSVARKLPVGSTTTSIPQPKADDDERLRTLWTAYGEDSSGVLRVAGVERLEALLFEIWTQQWPRLRRSFAFRTRYRVAESSAAFDLQLVERLHRDQTNGSLNLQPPGWLERLARDLIKPTATFRGFLRRFGAESENGKVDLQGLVGIWLQLEQEADPRELSTEVCVSFRKQHSMGELKRTLFGPFDAAKKIGPHGELERLIAILAARPAKALDLNDLEFEARVDGLWRGKGDDAVRLLCGLGNWEPSNKRALSILMRSAVENVSAANIVTVATSDDNLALALVEQRPDLLRSASLWRGDEPFVSELLELTRGLDSESRQEVVVALLKNNAQAASDVLAQEPALWWDGLEWAAAAIAEGRSLPRTVAALGRALETVGPGSVGSVPRQLPANTRVLLALVSRPPFGLWRQISAEGWAEVSDDVLRIEGGPMRSRGLVVLLAASGLPASAGTRSELWQKTFGPLHHAIEADEVDQADLGSLDELLPKPSESWQIRLRKGLVKEIRKDHWTPQEVKRSIDSVPAHRKELLEALESKKKGRRSWMREIFDFVTQ
jgi:hypothetical protein